MLSIIGLKLGNSFDTFWSSKAEEDKWTIEYFSAAVINEWTSFGRILSDIVSRFIDLLLGYVILFAFASSNAKVWKKKE